MATYPVAGSTNWYGTLKAYIDDVGALAYKVSDAPYNAVGDGTTDNATAINAAITAANAAGGGTVLVPGAAQPFAVGSPIVMKSNVALMVFGTIKALATHTGAGITATDISNFSIGGPGTIDMNKAATVNGGVTTAQQGIAVTTSAAVNINGVQIRDVTVANCWQRGIQVSANATGSVSNVAVQHTTVSAAGDIGIYCAAAGNSDGVTPSTSSGFWVEQNTVANPGRDGITVTGISDAHIQRNVVTATGSPTGHGICVGLGIAANTTDHCTDFTVADNKVRGFTATGKLGIVVSARGLRFSLTDNVVRGCNGAMSIDVTDPNNGTAILDTDGSVTGNTLAGSTVSHGLYINHAASLTVTGNTSRGNAGAGIALATSTGVTVTGNLVKSNTVHGIAIFGTTAGVGGHTITDNTSTGNTSGDYYTEAAPVASIIDRNASDAAVAETTTPPAGSTAETTLYAYTVPANTSQVGSTYRITVGLLVDNQATSGTLTLRLHYGTAGVTVASSVIPTQAGAATNQQIFAEYLVTVRAVGTSASVMAMGNLRSQFSSVDSAVGATLQTTNTTIDKVINFTAQWATASASNVCKLETATAEVVKT